MKIKLDKILLLLIVFIVCLCSVGYSVLNKNLNISGDLTYKPVGDVRITNVTSSELSNATVEYLSFSKKEIKLGYTSTGQASLTFTIELTNYANIPMGILKIDGLEGGSLSGYTLGTRLKDENDYSKAGMITTFTITFTSSIAEVKTFLLKFDFEPVYEVKYDGFKDDSNFKKEVLENDTFIQNFGAVPPGAILVLMNDNVTKNYTYKDGELKIPDVTGNIFIRVVTARRLAYDSSKTGLNCLDVQCAIDEINNIIEGKGISSNEKIKS